MRNRRIKQKTRLAVVAAAVLLATSSKAEHLITDINYEQYQSLIYDNIQVGRINFKYPGTDFYVSNRHGDSQYINFDVSLGSNPIGTVLETGLVIEWDQDGAGNLELAATLPSSVMENLSVRPVNWFDTIVIGVISDGGEVTLRNDFIDDQAFRDLSVLGQIHTYVQTGDLELSWDNAEDYIMIRLDGYTASNQPPLTISTIFKTKILRLDGSDIPSDSGDDAWGLGGKCNIWFLQTEADPEDVDGDELPDWWETEHFDESVDVDPDDICSNEVNTVRDAYIAGLDPNDPFSFFEVSNVWNRLWWNATSGRVYNIYWTTNLLDTFQPLETNFTGNTFTDTTHGVEEKGFYKIDVRLDD